MQTDEGESVSCEECYKSGTRDGGSREGLGNVVRSSGLPAVFKRMRSVVMELRGDWTQLADDQGVQRRGHMGGSSLGELTDDSLRLR